MFNVNKFTGTFPSSIFNIPRLELVFAYQNAFFGPLPASVGNASNVVSLDLINNLFSLSCRLLSLIENCFTGTIPSTIGQLSSLLSLDISYNYFNGSLPQALGNCLNLSLIAINSRKLFSCNVFIRTMVRNNNCCK
jgi:Leucine-rich repeat (LRR) protein